MAKPTTPGTYFAYFDNYIKNVDTDSVAEAVGKYSSSLLLFFKNIPADKHEFSYAEGKWTVKEMLLHIIDTERIFSYRAMCIARADETPFPGFDENSYAANSNANARTYDDLYAEFEAVRRSTDLLLLSFNKQQLQRKGTTSGHPNTVNAIAFVIFGHILHHKKIVEERYL